MELFIKKRVIELDFYKRIFYNDVNPLKKIKQSKSNRESVVGGNRWRKLWDTLEEVMKVTVSRVKTERAYIV